jgi:hypothetical protein
VTVTSAFLHFELLFRSCCYTTRRETLGRKLLILQVKVVLHIVPIFIERKLEWFKAVWKRVARTDSDSRH